MSRLPSFIILGAAKSGTTTLYRWLGTVPGCVLPQTKEPNFFISSNWNNGLSEYSRLFEPIRPELVTGEASVAYTRLDLAETAATRIASAIPSVRLIYVMRHPVERLRSHYRHELQRGRETRPPEEALADIRSAYATSSLYDQCTRPYRDRFSAEQLLFLRSEDLFSPTEITAWRRILTHLNLPAVSRPDARFNETASKRQFTGLLLKWWERGGTRSPLVQVLPPGMKRLGYRIISRRSSRYDRWMQESDSCPVAPAVLDRIWADIAGLEDFLGGRLWERSRD